MAAVRGVPDGAGEAPCEGGGDHGERLTRSSRAGSKVVFDGFTKVYEADRREDERAYLPDMTKGDTLDLKATGREPAFHKPPSALLGGDPHKDSRGQGDRTPFHLCGHSEHHPGEGLRPQGKREPRAGAARQDGPPAPLGILPQGDRRRFYRADGGGPRPHRGGGKKLGRVPERVLRRPAGGDGLRQERR